MMERYFRYCLEGNVLSAYHYLNDLQTKTEEQQDLIKKYEQIFFTEIPEFTIHSDDPWVQDVISAYYRYFILVLTKKYTNEQAEESLYLSLVESVPGNPQDMDEVEAALETEFNRKGYHFLGGYTLPYRGPYIWRKQEKKEYEVELPFSKQNMTIYLMDEFLLLSWLHFAAFGLKSTGGWAKADGLYCVRSRYGETLENDLFQVTFLKHEAQHVDDFKKYPDLSSWELEYRAKLVELIYGKSEKLLSQFMNEAVNNPAFPHLFAAYKIKQAFNEKDLLFHQTIKDFALELYKDHTDQLNVKYFN
jgi:hypothetical protein